MGILITQDYINEEKKHADQTETNNRKAIQKHIQKTADNFSVLPIQKISFSLPLLVYSSSYSLISFPVASKKNHTQ